MLGTTEHRIILCSNYLCKQLNVNQYIYRIAGNIGSLLIWRIAQKSCVMKYWRILIWQHGTVLYTHRRNFGGI